MVSSRKIIAAAAGLILAAAALLSCTKDPANVFYGTWSRQSGTLVKGSNVSALSGPKTLTFSKNGKVKVHTPEQDTTYFFAYNLELGVISFNTTGYYMELYDSEMVLNRSWTEGEGEAAVECNSTECFVKKQ